MAEFNIVLNGKVDAQSVNKSLKEIEKEINPINLKVKSSGTKTTGDISGKTSSSKNIDMQLKKATRATEDFNTKLKNLKTTGGLTKDQFNDFSDKLANLNSQLSSNNITAADFNDKMHSLKNEVSEASTATKAMGQSILDIVGKFTKWYLISGVVTGTINSLKQMVQDVISLDAAMVELNKVFDGSEEELEKVKDRAYEVANQVGRTGIEVINATTEFKRMGYTIDESLNLAKVATMMTNVAEGIDDTAEAAQILTSILKGIGVDAKYATSLLDRMNKVSNENAVSFDALAHMLQDSSATMKILGNNTDETIGLLTGAFGVLQDERVAKGIQTIGLRIAGLNEDLESEAGLANEVSDALKKYAGINVFDEQTGQLKNTYQIMKELSGVWDTLSKNEQSVLLNQLAGKQRADVAAAILTNWEEVEKAVEDASNSINSAQEEQEKYLNSIEGKVNTLKNTFQALGKSIIESDFIKGIVDLGTKIISVINTVMNKIGGLKTVLIALGTVFVVLKAKAIAGVILSIGTMIKSIPKLIAKIIAWTTATWAQVTAEGALKAATTMGVAAIAIAAGITGIVIAVNSAKSSMDDLNSSANAVNDTYYDLADTYGDATDNVTEYTKALQKLKKELTESNTNNKKALETLKENNKQLEKENELKEKLLNVEKARQEFAEAKQKRVRVFRAGIGFTYEEDISEIQEAQENLQEALDSLSEYKYNLAYDRAQEFVDRLNELLTSGDIVEGWDSLFTEFSDLLDSQFANYLTEAQKFVDEYNKTLEKLNAISPEEQAEANEAYNKAAYELSQKRKEQQSYALTSEEQELYQASKYNEEFKRQYENLPEWNPQKKFIRDILQDIEDKLSKYDVASKEVEELEKKLASMPRYAGGTSNSKGGISSTGEHGWEMMNLPKGTEIISHQNSVRLSSIADNPAKYFSNATRGQTVLQFNGPLNFPNVRTAEDANGFISEITNLGISKIPQL